MKAAYFLHVHGAAGAGAPLAAAVEKVMRSFASVAVLHTPIVLPGSDPLPVDQDARLLLVQLEGSHELAARVDKSAREIAGVREVTHQTMATERITPGGPDNPRAKAQAVSWFVQYNGPAKDPAAFHAYYRRHHVPIVHRMPGIRSLNWYVPMTWAAPANVHKVDYLQLVQAMFDDVEGLLAMRRSPQRKEGLKDFDNYPSFEGPVTHQAMLSRRISQP
jgi:uncharacterized protein (TIGR02118 family)